jgi:hypothetical protein
LSNVLIIFNITATPEDRVLLVIEPPAVAALLSTQVHLAELAAEGGLAAFVRVILGVRARMSTQELAVALLAHCTAVVLTLPFLQHMAI